MILDLIMGSPRTDWCDVCLLPSVVEFDIYQLTDDGLVLLGIYRQCQEQHA